MRSHNEKQGQWVNEFQRFSSLITWACYFEACSDIDYHDKVHLEEQADHFTVGQRKSPRDFGPTIPLEAMSPMT